MGVVVHGGILVDSSSGVLLKMEVCKRKQVWQRA